MNKFWLFFIIIFSVLIGISCDSSSKVKTPSSGLKIHRYEQALFSIEPNNLKAGLKEIQPEYSFFLNGNIEDSSNIIRLYNFVTDTVILSAYNAVDLKFNDISIIENKIESLFSNYIEHFYGATFPDVYSYVSGYDVFGPVQYYDSVLLIALDMYLGKGYQGYVPLGLPNYIVSSFDQKYLVRDCAYEISGKFVIKSDNLLELMLLEGKRLFFIKELIPDISEEILFKFSLKQLNWADRYEENVWAFLIENELIYSSEKENIKKFLTPAPFTAYFGEESPSRLGSFIGYKIVKSYMDEHTSVELKNLMLDNNFAKILKTSAYRPGR